VHLHPEHRPSSTPAASLASPSPRPSHQRALADASSATSSSPPLTVQPPPQAPRSHLHTLLSTFKHRPSTRRTSPKAQLALVNKDARPTPHSAATRRSTLSSSPSRPPDPHPRATPTRPSYRPRPPHSRARTRMSAHHAPAPSAAAATTSASRPQRPAPSAPQQQQRREGGRTTGGAPGEPQQRRHAREEPAMVGPWRIGRTVGEGSSGASLSPPPSSRPSRPHD